MAKIDYSKLTEDLLAAKAAALGANQATAATSQEIRVGSLVRSYDFEHRRDCYIEGRVCAFTTEEGCPRYEIRAYLRCSAGERRPDDGVYYPPVNGTPMLFGESETTNFVEAITYDDGGTCNMDAAVLVLPRAPEAKVEAALKAAGMHGFKWRPGFFTVSPPSCFQGNARTREAEALEKVLSERGWKTSMYYQMD